MLLLSLLYDMRPKARDAPECITRGHRSRSAFFFCIYLIHDARSKLLFFIFQRGSRALGHIQTVDGGYHGIVV